jgi:membrane protein YqaA with SNARE-associated domain
MGRRVQRFLKRVTHYSDRWWFAPLMAFLSAIDAFVLVIPNEPIIAAGVLARPKCWLSLSLWMTLGSALGAVALAWLVSTESEWILRHFVSEKMLHSKSWHESMKLIDDYGLWGLAAVSLSPLPQHAAVIIVGLAEMPLDRIFLAVLVGRLPKYVGTGWLAAKSPEVLKRWKILPKD